MGSQSVVVNMALADVRCEIRGQLAHRAEEPERRIYEPVSLSNTPRTGHVRITTLPKPDTIDDVFERIETQLGQLG
jgi:hypothetical protein